jgi:carboxymethylenebutenolidase
MSGSKRDESGGASASPTRREFMAASATLGLAAAAGVALAGGRESPVLEHEVDIATADGRCDAVFLHPATGVHPGVLIWTDIFGLRPVFRAMGRRLAARGYSVLVPNPFYRTGRAPLITDVPQFDFGNRADRAKLERWTAPLAEPGPLERDAEAYVGFLDAQPQVSRGRKLGTQGYCWGGPAVFRTAARVPGRIGAAATFHGAALVTDKPDSPYRLAPRIRARMYVAIAASDDARQPDAKEKLREAFSAAHVTADVVVYPGTQHGWCIADMPLHDGRPIYDPAEAERAWGKLLELYEATLG